MVVLLQFVTSGLRNICKPNPILGVSFATSKLAVRLVRYSSLADISSENLSYYVNMPIVDVLWHFSSSMPQSATASSLVSKGM